MRAASLVRLESPRTLDAAFSKQKLSDRLHPMDSKAGQRRRVNYMTLKIPVWIERGLHNLS
jgi:hypothetical protein